MKRRKKITLPAAVVTVAAQKEHEGWLEDYKTEDYVRRKTEQECSHCSFDEFNHYYNENLSREANRSWNARLEYEDRFDGGQAKLFCYEKWIDCTVVLAYEYRGKQCEAVEHWPDLRNAPRPGDRLYVTVTEEEPGQIMCVETEKQRKGRRFDRAVEVIFGLVLLAVFAGFLFTLKGTL